MMQDKKRTVSMFMVLAMMFCLLTAEPFNSLADEMPAQGTIYSGPGTEHSVVETVDGDADLQVYGEIDNWYIVYNSETGNVGCIARDNVSEETVAISDTSVNSILTYTNKERENAGLTPVTLDKDLCAAASTKAADMVKNNYFSHHSEILGSPFEMLKKCGVIFTKAAENLAGNTTAEGAFYSWMNSSAQRDNILCADYTRVGIGISNSPVYGQIFVQVFAN